MAHHFGLFMVGHTVIYFHTPEGMWSGLGPSFTLLRVTDCCRGSNCYVTISVSLQKRPRRVALCIGLHFKICTATTNSEGKVCKDIAMVSTRCPLFRVSISGSDLWPVKSPQSPPPTIVMVCHLSWRTGRESECLAEIGSYLNLSKEFREKALAS